MRASMNTISGAVSASEIERFNPVRRHGEAQASNGALRLKFLASAFPFAISTSSH